MHAIRQFGGRMNEIRNNKKKRENESQIGL